MRGLFFKAPLECSLEVQGDSFSQGDTIQGTFRVKNRGAAAIVVSDLTVSLALGNAKKIKAKQSGAFSPIAPAAFERGTELAVDQQASFPIAFALDNNSPISDKNQSLYLVAGNETAPDAVGALLVSCAPHPHIRTVVETLGSVYGFTDKGASWKDGWTSYKLKAPDTRKLSLVDELVLSCQFDGEDLCTKYQFKVKSFDTSATSVNVKRGKTEVLQRWSPSEYLFGSGFVRQEFIEKQIDDALSVVSTGF